MEENCKIVLDNGSETIKAGFSKNALPSILIPTIVWIPKDQSEKKRFSIGVEAKSN